MTSITDAPEITWTILNAAGIDTDRARKVQGGHTDSAWEYTSGDGQLQVSFGECPDPENIVPDGDHTGWAWHAHERDTENENWIDAGHGNSDYEPHQLGAMLADVRKFIDD